MVDQLAASEPSIVNSLTTELANVSVAAKPNYGDKRSSDACCAEELCKAHDNLANDIDDIDDDNDIASSTPSDFNSGDHLFHINFLRSIQHIPTDIKRFKNGTRKSCTFTNEQMRQIERENRILLEKILSHGPAQPQRRNSTSALGALRVPSSSSSSSSSSRIPSAAVNRKKRQKTIDFDNDILRKKIERIARRPTK